MFESLTSRVSIDIYSLFIVLSLKLGVSFKTHIFNSSIQVLALCPLVFPNVTTRELFGSRNYLVRRFQSETILAYVDVELTYSCATLLSLAQDYRFAESYVFDSDASRLQIACVRAIEPSRTSTEVLLRWRHHALIAHRRLLLSTGVGIMFPSCKLDIQNIAAPCLQVLSPRSRSHLLLLNDLHQDHSCICFRFQIELHSSLLLLSRRQSISIPVKPPAIALQFSELHSACPICSRS